MKYTDKVCVVTGGALGIGRCLCEAFIQRGAKVAFIDKEKEAGESLLSHLSAQGEALFFHGDVGEKEDLEAFVSQVEKTFGRVDILINNACLSRKGILTPCSYEDFTYVLRVGVAAPYYLTQQLLPHFQKGASVVNISSTRAWMSQGDTESYSAAKGGISALTHALAVSFAGRVRVNAIAPGWIDTDYTVYKGPDAVQQPAGRVGNPMDIANMVLYLCSDKAGFITGENICIDGGMTRQMIYHNDFGWRLEETT